MLKYEKSWRNTIIDAKIKEKLSMERIREESNHRAKLEKLKKRNLSDPEIVFSRSNQSNTGK